eukprot:3342614-Rhodomonas_salina.2
MRVAAYATREYRHSTDRQQHTLCQYGTAHSSIRYASTEPHPFHGFHPSSASIWYCSPLSSTPPAPRPLLRSSAPPEPARDGAREFGSEGTRPVGARA